MLAYFNGAVCILSNCGKAQNQGEAAAKIVMSAISVQGQQMSAAAESHVLILGVPVSGQH